ncbi:MAG: hypothetical protein E6Q97_22500 [Desulfurellales bacterium]|nr:MAG: hypothetical protein E6Q97_22500 [Desulfurellales bacterium]
MKKTIDTSVVTPEMESAMKVVFVKTIHKMAMAFGQPLPSTEEIDAAWIDSIGGCTEYYKAALEAAPGVKEEPFCYTHKNAQVEFDHGLSARIADFQDDYWSIPLYLHPPTASDLVERIRALEIAEPMGWMDKCHNGVVAKIVELIEGAKCATQND